ncbi:DUF502 domain-containing protein [Palleronia caenipelagi]|uniref:DUF502 domain-containing protein n=1 Tax=Palleronia caenipelagi TaxID=2489174 RepID=A0A547Q5Z6_9RHOB|nr:DUF502 domain-containing protein [Palleronia caenipelagi]TRD21797.1 DUF502 domain-containing protein [Palleronia caenipelagi]
MKLDPNLDIAPPIKKPGLFARIRSNFLTGLVVIIPIGVTIWIVWTVIGWVDSVVLPLVPNRFQPDQYFGVNLRGIGVLFFLVFTFLIGWVAKGYFGRLFLRSAEHLVSRTPIVRTVYSGVKQIAETIFAQSETSFDKAVLVEYPRRGIWAIGFISTETKGEVADLIPSADRKLAVFVPTTPNPTSGFLLFIPATEVLNLEMSVEEAAKLVISAGLVYPNPKDPTKPANDDQPAIAAQ